MSKPGTMSGMAKRTYFLNYVGHCDVHRVYSKLMLHWILAEAKFHQKPTFCSLTIDHNSCTVQKEDEVLIDLEDTSKQSGTKHANTSNEVLSAFSHPLAPIDSVVDQHSNALNSLPLTCNLEHVAEIILPNEFNNQFVGLLKTPCHSDTSFVCHVFYHKDPILVKEVSETLNKFLSWFNEMCPTKVAAKQLQDLDCVRFEVMMLGKIQARQENPQNTFIDEAVEKYHKLEMEHFHVLNADQKLLQTSDNSTSTSNSIPSLQENGVNPFKVPASLFDGSTQGSADIIRRNSSAWLNRDTQLADPVDDRQRCNSIDGSSALAAKQKVRKRIRHCSEPSSTSGLGFDKNKTRLLQIGKESITIICPDPPGRRMEIQFTDIIRCAKGIENKDHFGIFARDLLQNQRKDDVKFRCYLFKCSDETVCDEVLVAMKQSCSMCAHGPDPLKSYHALCKRINYRGSGSTVEQWVERGKNTAAKFIADSLSDRDQMRVRKQIDEYTPQAESKYEKLAVVMMVLRHIYGDKQQEHDIKMKQLREPNSSSGVVRKLSFFKSRAKKSLSSFENFFEKGIQKVHDQLHDSEHNIASPIEKLKFFGDNPRSAPNTPGSSNYVSHSSNHSTRFRNRSGSPSPGVELSPLAGGASSKPQENFRPRSNTLGAVDQSSIFARRKLQLDEENSDPALFTAPTPLKVPSNNLAASTNSLRSSFSSPFFGRTLEDVQESPSEGANQVTLSSSRFSLSRLFGLTEKPVDNNAKNLPVPIPARCDEPPGISPTGAEIPERRVAKDAFAAVATSSPPTKSASMHALGRPAISDAFSDPTYHPLHPRIAQLALEDRLDRPMPRGRATHDPGFSPTKVDAALLSADHDSTVSSDKHPSIVITHDDQEGFASSAESSDDEDLGIFFVAQGLSSSKPGEQCRPAGGRLPSASSEKEENENISLPLFDPEVFAVTHGGGAKFGGMSSESTPIQSRSSTPSIGSQQRSNQNGGSTEKKMSFHQQIFCKVTGSSTKKKKEAPESPPALKNHMRPLTPLKTPDDVRYAWKRAIRDQILINRINNIPNTVNGDGATSNATSEANLKCRYIEVCPRCDEMDVVWTELLDTEGRSQYKIDPTVLSAAVRRGVSKHLRGRVWTLLHEQWKLRHQEERRSSSVLLDLPYDELLKSLTPHQHAILIDLGRTFPTHPYFSQQLKNGQLELYNILKAYSLLDADVGYCQGLSFVAGILLMHTNSTEHAFTMLCHLMTEINCRVQYLPDMAALRVSVYQLSRLLYDFHRDLYDHFEAHDVSMILFATPWFLTMFGSVLSFGFTARIFDLLFLEGKSALFKVALSLLSHHKQKILAEDSFESVVGYLKNNLPRMDDDTVQEVMKEVFQLDLSQTLEVYAVEYDVLEDGEIFGLEVNNNRTSPPEDTKESEQKITRLEHVNQTVTSYYREVVEKLEAANTQIKSLQQGLNDMAVIDEKKTMEMEELKQENEDLKKRLIR